MWVFEQTSQRLRLGNPEDQKRHETCQSWPWFAYFVHTMYSFFYCNFLATAMICCTRLERRKKHAEIGRTRSSIESMIVMTVTVVTVIVLAVIVIVALIEVVFSDRCSRHISHDARQMSDDCVRVWCLDGDC